MIEWIKTWTSEIIIAVIISIIIEMLVPEGKNKKYVKVVSGIYILYTIINPFLNISEIKFESIEINNNVLKTNADLTVTNTYIGSLEEYLKSEIEALNYKVRDINVICDKEYTNILEVKIKMQTASYDENAIKDIVSKEIEIDLSNIIIE